MPQDLQALVFLLSLSLKLTLDLQPPTSCCSKGARIPYFICFSPKSTQIPLPAWYMKSVTHSLPFDRSQFRRLSLESLPTDLLSLSFFAKNTRRSVRPVIVKSVWWKDPRLHTRALTRALSGCGEDRSEVCSFRRFHQGFNCQPLDLRRSGLGFGFSSCHSHKAKNGRREIRRERSNLTYRRWRS